MRWIERKDRAIAELESEQYEASIALFEELAKELPAEPLVATDLVVAYILLLKSPAMGPSSGSLISQQTAERAEQAVFRLLQIAGGSATSHVLAAKVARLRSDERRSQEELNRAVALAPDDPVVWYELFQAGRHAEDARVKARAREGLKRAYELWPDNLCLIRERLLQQASDREAAITETLAKARATIEPLVERSPTWRRLNLLSMIDQAVAAVADHSRDGEDKWSTVLQRVRRVTNVLSAEHATRIDRRRIDRQDQADLAELAFVVHDFSTAVVAAEASVPEEAAAPISVKLVPLPDEVPLTPRSPVCGVELVDFDLDGQLDAVVVRERAVEVYRRGTEGHAWELCTAFRSPNDLRGIVAADLDRDVDSAAAAGSSGPLPNADWDLVAYGPYGLTILENVLDEKTGSRSLQAVQQDAVFEQLRNVLAVAAVDLDQDGHLDLIVSSSTGISLWLRRDGFAWEDISGRASLPPADLKALAIVPVDWNRDGDVDVLLASSTSKAAGYLANLRHGRFRWEPILADGDNVSGTRVLCLADVDGNRSWDLLAGGEHGLTLAQTEASSSGAPRWTESSRLGTGAVAGMTTWDYDNDGHLDVLTWSRDGLRIYRRGSDRQFRPASGLLDAPPSRVEACAVGDVDRDGDWDLLVAEPDRLAWYTNEGGNRNHWLDVSLHADPYPSQSPDLAVNMHGLGSLLEVKTGSRCQRQLVTRSVSHFGLGASSKADVVRILWTNGTPCNTLDAESNRLLSKPQKHEGM